LLSTGESSLLAIRLSMNRPAPHAWWR
jgi:hypothetical protein